jgi:hypothetical protein
MTRTVGQVDPTSAPAAQQALVLPLAGARTGARTDSPPRAQILVRGGW